MSATAPHSRPQNPSVMRLETLITHIVTLKPGRRILVAVAGPPAAGKSTLSHELALGLQAAGRSAAVVPMDGFHLDDAVLGARGDLARKGAPWTFDVGGFSALVARLAANAEDVVYVPVFDRTLELSRAGARAVPSDTEVLVIEGNYLLLKDPDWAGAAKHYDLTVMIDTDHATLERRLIERWLGFGLAADAARTKASENDLPNGAQVLNDSRPADVHLVSDGAQGA